MGDPIKGTVQVRSKPMSQMERTNYHALTSLVSVFFFWGFIASGNSIFIPFCKQIFGLDQFLSQLIDFAFYFAYFIGAFLIFLYLQLRRINIVAYWGYKKSIVLGLLISALGAAAMNIAVLQHTFSGLLIGLFVLAFGFSLQQIAAQPLAISLGPAATGAHRISLGGAVNSLGTMIAPVLISLVLFGFASAQIPDNEQLSQLDLEKMFGLYAIVFFLFLVAATFIGYNKRIPNESNSQPQPPARKALWMLTAITGLTSYLFFEILWTYQMAGAGDGTAELTGVGAGAAAGADAAAGDGAGAGAGNEAMMLILRETELSRFYYLLAVLIVIVGGLIFTVWNAAREASKTATATAKSATVASLFAATSTTAPPSQWGAMRHPQLVWGMLAIFFYVGVEVSIASNLGELLKSHKFGGYPVSDVAPFLSLYWGSLMIGRWAAAIEVFQFAKKTKYLLQILLPILAFALILLLNWQELESLPLQGYGFLVAVFLIIFFLSKNKPRRTLLVFSGFGLLLMTIGLFSTGIIAVYAFIAGGLACSILWPAIFSLSLAKLGKDTTQGSAFLIMMILGGAVLPPIQGKLADLWGIHFSFILPALCFAYLLAFGFFMKGILARIQVDYDQ